MGLLVYPRLLLNSFPTVSRAACLCLSLWDWRKRRGSGSWKYSVRCIEWKCWTSRMVVSWICSLLQFPACITLDCELYYWNCSFLRYPDFIFVAWIGQFLNHLQVFIMPCVVRYAYYWPAIFTRYYPRLCHLPLPRRYTNTTAIHSQRYCSGLWERRTRRDQSVWWCMIRLWCWCVRHCLVTLGCLRWFSMERSTTPYLFHLLKKYSHTPLHKCAAASFCFNNDLVLSTAVSNFAVLLLALFGM